jgi:peptide/nickel transport system substrate-binding protein
MLAALLALFVSSSATAVTGKTGASDASLTVLTLSKPTNLNPALNAISASDVWYSSLAYDSLIHLGSKGKLQPGLATSWKYVGAGNMRFQLTLRPGVKFSDGSPVTAAAVAQSLNYTRKAGGGTANWISGISSITALNRTTVDVKLSKGNPELPFLFSTPIQLGDIINPKALDSVGDLGHSTAGAGPYMLDPSQTVSEDHYAYVPNPHYWNKSAIHYKKVTIKVVSNTSAALQTLRTGAADVALGDINTAASAKSAGLRVYSALVAQTGIDLLDRTGVISKPLADVRVRQALNYAVDRKKIASSLLGSTGTPVNQVGAPATPDYLARSGKQYAYNPTKAKQLLAQAGYADGFTVNMAIFGANPPAGDVAQAVISDWGKIGVKVDANTTSDGGAYVQAVFSKKYATFSYGYGYIPFYLYSQNWYMSTANPFNLFETNDSQLTTLVEQGNAASGAKRQSLYERATQRALDLAWVVPVASYSVFYFASPKVGNVKVDPARALLDLTELTPAGQ